MGAAETVLKTVSISESKTTYKHRWTPKQAGDYVLKVSAYFNNSYVQQIKVTVRVDNPLKLKYKLLKNGQSYVVGEDVKMHIRVTGDVSKADELRFIVQKIGEKNRVDKTEAIVPSKSMYYNKWVPSSTGEYRLKVKAYKNGSYVKMTSAKIKVTSSKSMLKSIPEASEKKNQDVQISVYPNPNNGVVNIDLTGVAVAEINVYNTSGQKVYQEKGISGICQFEIKGNPGMYFIEVDSGSGKQIFKVVKN